MRLQRPVSSPAWGLGSSSASSPVILATRKQRRSTVQKTPFPPYWVMEVLAVCHRMLPPASIAGQQVREFSTERQSLHACLMHNADPALAA